MKKKQIIKSFHRLRGVEAKEEFMKRNGIKFTYDSFYNMTVWADDGILQLFPIKQEKGGICYEKNVSSFNYTFNHN